jgi:hypothetical protein
MGAPLDRSERKEELHMARFQSFWFGDVLPPCQTLCMKSFIDHGHDYDLYSYGSPAVPEGVRLLNADEILPRSEVFFYRSGEGRGSVACFANMFRYRLLMLRGGWWVDTDVVCLSSKIPEGETFLERESEDLICNAVLKFPKGHAFVNVLYEKSREAGRDLEWGQTGPGLVSALARQMGLWDQAELHKRAYPIHWREAFLPVTPSDRSAAYERTRSASFLHLWNEIFRRKGSLALHNPPNGSLLADLYKQHGVERRFWALVGHYKLEHWRKKTRVFTGKLLKRLMLIVRAGR